MIQKHDEMAHILFLARVAFLSVHRIYKIPSSPLACTCSACISITRELKYKGGTVNVMAIKIWPLTKSLNILSYCCWL